MLIDSTRASYDTVAADYHEVLKDNLRENPYDRAALDLFAELVPTSPVGDLGCGPGRITTYLAGRGLDAFGVDLWPGMVEVARRLYPELRFEVGSLFDLDLKDGELAGALAWYSLVHTPREDLSAVFAELYRVLRPGGYLLHAFKVGTGTRHLTNAYGHDLELDVYLFEPADVTSLLGDAGFVEVATLTHAQLPVEKEPQGYVLVRKPD
jgi:SAM-dependent methyltransferase